MERALGLHRLRLVRFFCSRLADRGRGFEHPFYFLHVHAQIRAKKFCSFSSRVPISPGKISARWGTFPYSTLFCAVPLFSVPCRTASSGRRKVRLFVRRASSLHRFVILLYIVYSVAPETGMLAGYKKDAPAEAGASESRSLSLGELGSAACGFQAVLLSLLHSRVAGQEACLLQHGTEILRIVL